MCPLLVRARLRALVVVLVAAAAALAATQQSGLAQTDGATVDVVQVSGPLDARVASHITSALDRAEAQGVEAVVIEMDSQGGLGLDGRELAGRVAESPVPVAVWVGPPGARAGGAAALVAQSAHVLATSQASVLGPVAPLDLRDDGADEPGLADELAALAAERGRDADAAAGLLDGGLVTVPDDEPAEVPDAAALPWSLTGQAEALRASDVADAGAADLVAAELPDVLRGLDGMEVAVGGGEERSIELDPVTARVRFDNLGLLDRVLHAMTDPALAYVLVVGGLLGVAFEFFQPGFGVAGVAGALVAALGAYGLVVLPVAWWAVLLLLAGLALLAVDLAIAGLGVPTVAGTAAFAAGSWWLFDGPPPVQPPVWVLGLVVALVVLFFVVIMTVVLRAQGDQTMAGAEEVVGKAAVVRSMLNPQGHVYVDGALWRARAPEAEGRVPTGTTVRITGVDAEHTCLDVEVLAPEEATRSA